MNRNSGRAVRQSSVRVVASGRILLDVFFQTRGNLLDGLNNASALTSSTPLLILELVPADIKFLRAGEMDFAG